MSNDGPFIVIFSDLDGTLLDHDSYQWEDARPAIEKCIALRVPVILVSSKTRAEMDVLRREMALSDPFISENGGGIFFPEKETRKPPSGTILASHCWQWTLGCPYESLVQCLRDIRNELGWKLRGFSDMDVREIRERTGLDLHSAMRASKRDFDEPFFIDQKQGKSLEALHAAAGRRGLRITEGGRFFHLHGRNDKGDAVDKITDWYKGIYPSIYSVALGDSPNDWSMLKRVDLPILIRSSRDFSDIRETIPKLTVSRKKGPQGWNEAVLEVLEMKHQGAF
ncbi:MAG: HAD-IIB family hydrolase [Deltaproteobacteria bacterium]|nr:HAD-IIB family hydrolase [Deltaproteobacteria bacterium]